LIGGREATVTATSVEGVMETRVAMVTAAAQTEQAALATTQAVPTAAMPETGFADEVGIPGLLALAVVFVVVIFLVRRLRTARA
jgi:hypothetical protein